MRRFLMALFAKEESVIDSVVFAGFASLLVFFGMTIFVVVRDPSAWSGVTFAGSAGAIIAIFAGGKTARDRLSSPDAAQVPVVPK
jgi:hypothetical protein